MQTAFIFTQTDTFAATYAAEAALKKHGFSIGSMQRGAPRGVMLGDYLIAKWRNLNHDERRSLHATLEGDGREGPLTLRLVGMPRPDVREAFNALIAAEQVSA